jgi:hypothetical protein
MHIMLFFCEGLGLEHAVQPRTSFIGAYYIKLVHYYVQPAVPWKQPQQLQSDIIFLQDDKNHHCCHVIHHLLGDWDWEILSHLHTVQTLHLVSSFCILTSRIHWEDAGLNPQTLSTLRCDYGVFTLCVGFTTGLQLVICHSNGISAKNLEQSLWSGGCVWLMCSFVCFMLIEQLCQAHNPIQETSEDRWAYMMTVFFMRFEYLIT